MEGFNRHKFRNASAFTAEIEGRIQGVGFRPFIFRLAAGYGLSGWVRNCSEGVEIYIEGTPEALKGFLSDIKKKAPPAARVETVRTSPSEVKHYANFSIVKSESSQNNNNSNSAAEISPDIAVCPDCLKDIKNDPLRKNYPFTNCTNCGPRFSIIKALPYDRDKTTMDPFIMCGRCRSEYEDVMNRRFHAQPNSCRSCGPYYTFHRKGLPPINGQPGTEELILKAGETVKNGGIIAVKGIGGYHLACDPFNGESVRSLRRLKKREGKPFALMFADMKSIEKYAFLTDPDRDILRSPQAPIVILKQKKDNGLSPEVNAGLNSIGCFLPYAPFHHLFFMLTGIEALVLTSANSGGEPIVKENGKALSLFLDNTDGVLTYNRDIHNRCDDSVGFTARGSFRLIRRSRGWAPDSIKTTFDSDSIFAAGGDLKNTFCIGKGQKAVLSQHIGNLENPDTYNFYRDTVKRFEELFRFAPKAAAYDLHPDYRSSAFAKTLGIPLIGVQHHHAHIASCLAENGEKGPVIGFIFDGTGYGDDGNIWGGEIFTADMESFERKLHLKYIPLPGGDKAVIEPWRTALSALYTASGDSSVPPDMPFLREIEPDKAEMILKMIDRRVNSPLSSGMGRLFDAVAAMLNLCSFSTFEAEGPIRLEAAATDKTEEYYPITFSLKTGVIYTDELISEISGEILKGVPVSEISTKFHNSIIHLVLNAALELKKESGINKTALSGGVFNNRIILEGCENILLKHGFTVLSHKKVPAGDGGLALGQLAVAAARLKRGEIQCA